MPGRGQRRRSGHYGAAAAEAEKVLLMLSDAPEIAETVQTLTATGVT